MHSEYWELSETATRLIHTAKREGGRVISVGTTAVRLLENAALVGESDESLLPGSGWVDLFITPWLSIPRHRRADNKLPPAALDAADAGLRFRRTGACAERVSSSCRESL